MSAEVSDRWSRWLFRHRFEEPSMLTRFQEPKVDPLGPSAPRAILLDVDAGNVLAARALNEVWPGGNVVSFNESHPLLNRCREMMAEHADNVTYEFVLALAWTVPALADSREVGNRLSVKEDGDGIVAAEVHR